MSPEERAKAALEKRGDDMEVWLRETAHGASLPHVPSVQAYMADAIRSAEREARAAALEEAAKVADGWAENYPPDVFTGATEEGKRGQFGRHVSQCIAEDIRRSLKETDK